MSSPASQTRDQLVRTRVIERGRSFIVQAPAGSGKTELLMQRFLNLLTDPQVREPEQVLAITFTRKAAAQMRNRILTALEAASRPPAPDLREHEALTRTLALEVLRRDRELNWRLLEAPARLEVRTLDSFCDSVLRQAPLLESFAPAGEVTEQAVPLYEEAARQIVLLLGDADPQRSGPVRTLLAHLDNDAAKLEQLLVDMLARREQWLGLLGGTTHLLTDDALDELRRLRLEPALADAIRHELGVVRDAIQAAIPSGLRDELLGLMNCAAANLGDTDPDSPVAMLSGIDELPGTEPSDCVRWRGLREFFFTKQNGLRRALTKANGFPTSDREIKNRCLEIFATLGEAFQAAAAPPLARLSVLPPPAYPEPQWEALRALFRILPVATAALKVTFQQAGQVDFSEVSLGAKFALGHPEEPSELSHRIGARTRHVLVDEFQDTSISQFGLLERLLATWDPAEGRTLFLVGDPMQSIYGWRQAEVALFERARISGIGRWALVAADLTVNFRSQQRLVDWFNATFPHILTHLDDATGAVPYHRAEAHEPAGAAPVELHPRLDRDADAEAAQAVALIEQALGETEKGTVAVLVRARTHLPEIARILRQRGIRFRAVKTDPLGERQAVRDVDALARALLDLADRTAWLAVLRAPWCGLDLPDLAALCESDHLAAIWELLQARGDTLSVPARARLARVVPVLGDALSARGRAPLRLLVESSWLSLGGLAALPAGEDGASDRRDVEAYLDLLADVAEAEEMPEPRRVDSMLADLFAPTDTSAGIRVELMTIHTAKGLEFDTVLVPGLGRGKRRDDPRLLYWQEKKTGADGDQLLLGALEPAGWAGSKENTVEGYLRQLQRDRAAEEEKRLLYVAATRARRRLHLLGHVPLPKQDDAAIKPVPGSLLAILWEVPEIRAAFEALPRPTARAQETSEADEPAAVLLHRLPLEWTAAAPPAPLPWQASPAGSATEAPHTFDWAGDRLRRIGTVTHALLHRIAREGVATWNEATLASRTPAVRAALQGAGISPEDLEASTARVVAALGNVLRGDRGRWLLAAHDQARSEYEITAVLNGEVRRLKIDRTFVEDGVRWIVDYKVADREGGDREGFLLAQMEKYRPDLERYRAALQKIESRPARLALYFPLLNEFRELTERSVAADAL